MVRSPSPGELPPWPSRIGPRLFVPRGVSHPYVASTDLLAQTIRRDLRSLAGVMPHVLSLCHPDVDNYLPGRRLGRALADHDESEQRLPRRRRCPRPASRHQHSVRIPGMCLGTGHLHQQQGGSLAALALAGLRAATPIIKFVASDARSCSLLEVAGKLGDRPLRDSSGDDPMNRDVKQSHDAAMPGLTVQDEAPTVALQAQLIGTLEIDTSTNCLVVRPPWALAPAPTASSTSMWPGLQAGASHSVTANPP